MEITVRIVHRSVKDSMIQREKRNMKSRSTIKRRVMQLNTPRKKRI